MAYSLRYWYTIVKGMRKTIWIAGVLIEFQTERLQDTSEMCQTCEPCWPILVATACQIQERGVKLEQTMARDHITDSRTHHASHRKHLLPLYDHAACERHVPAHDGRTPVRCWIFFHSHPNNMQMHVECLVVRSFQPEEVCKPVSSKQFSPLIYSATQVQI
jgi:hypothetical protein